MGWQDRDYAKLHDEELHAIYNFRRPHGPGGRGLSTRNVIWTVVVCIGVAVFGFAWYSPSRTNGGPVQFAHPAVMYGSVITEGPLAGLVCTEFEFVSSAQRWRCDNAEGNEAHVPVYPATRYSGPCAHMRVEGHAWVCLSAVPQTGNA